jgi:hypothetical protein
MNCLESYHTQTYQQQGPLIREQNLTEQNKLHDTARNIPPLCAHIWVTPRTVK